MKREIRPSFSVSQNFDRSEVLELIKTYFECGSIRPDRSDKTLKFEVRSINELTKKINPHFIKYRLISSKQKDFELFNEICALIKLRAHQNLKGFKKIVRLAFQMNSTGKRKYSQDEILNSLGADEGIVYA